MMVMFSNSMLKAYLDARADRVSARTRNCLWRWFWYEQHGGLAGLLAATDDDLLAAVNFGPVMLREWRAAQAAGTAPPPHVAEGFWQVRHDVFSLVGG